jgi:hypothetical protein
MRLVSASCSSRAGLKLLIQKLWMSEIALWRERAGSDQKVSVRNRITCLNLAPKDLPRFIIKRWNAETPHFYL